MTCASTPSTPPATPWGRSASSSTAGPILFSGDTLFPGGPGNTAHGGDFPTIIKSLDERLLTLPADTIVLPGHGLDTTVGTERPHLQEWVDRGY